MLSTIRKIECQHGKQNKYMHPNRAMTRELVSSILVTDLSAAFVIPRPHFSGTARIITSAGLPALVRYLKPLHLPYQIQCALTRLMTMSALPFEHTSTANLVHQMSYSC